MHKLRLAFILSIALINSNKLFAQNIKTAKDTAVFIDCTQMPAAAPQYTLSFTAKDLELDFEEEDSKNEPKESLDILLEKLEKDPTDVEIAMNITNLYRIANDEKNYFLYLEHTFNSAKKAYIKRPDSFEIANQFTQVLQETQNIEGVLIIWNEYVTNKPKDIRGFTQLAIQLAVQGQVEKAQYFTEQAYQIDPQNTGVYIAAMMCEFTSTLMQCSAIMQSGKDKIENKNAINKIIINKNFFKKAIDNGAPIAAQMSKDATQIFVIFYRTILSAMDNNIGEEKIKLSTNKLDSKLLKEIEKRNKKLIQSKAKNLYFPYKILCTVEILKGNSSKAVDYWKNSGKFLKKDTDILRLLSFSHFLNMDFANAISYLEKKLDLSKEYDDSYALGRFYAYMEDLDKAFDVFGATMPLNPADRRAICARMSILIKKNNFEEAAAIMNNFTSEETDNIEAYHANYFKAVATLIQGDKNDAFKRLKAIHAESDYKKDADKLLAHFFSK
jgi:Flp pilus assembly protein TadD